MSDNKSEITAFGIIGKVNGEDMGFDNQKYKLYVTIALLHFEKKKIEEIFNNYNNRLTTINDNMKGLLRDINEFKTIETQPRHHYRWPVTQ